MEDNSKKGIVVGGTAAALGGTAMAGGKVLKDNYVGKGLTKVKSISTKNFREGVLKKLDPKQFKEVIKKSKKLGGATMAVGGTVAGVSAYKHYKNKKKDDSTEK